MRFLVNENVSGTVIQELRQRGHDVLAVKESMRSERDEVILARAQADERIVLTHDKDFGELAFRIHLPATCGVILLRVTGSDPDTDNQRILETLASRDDWAGHFSVSTDDRIRMRPALLSLPAWLARHAPAAPGSPVRHHVPSRFLCLLLLIRPVATASSPTRPRAGPARRVV
jgi:predicted nuclease of predicted toxin-antitoxin system